MTGRQAPVLPEIFLKTNWTAAAAFAADVGTLCELEQPVPQLLR